MDSWFMWAALVAILVGPHVVNGVVMIFRGQPEPEYPFRLDLDTPMEDGKLHLGFETEDDMLAFLADWPGRVKELREGNE